MPSLISPELEDYKDSTPPPAVVKPAPEVKPIDDPSKLTTVFNEDGKPSSILPDFDSAIDAAEEARAKGEEPAFDKSQEQKKKKKEEPKPEPERPAEEGKSKEPPAEIDPSKDEEAAQLMKVLPNDKPMTARRIKKFLNELEFKEKTIAEKEAIIKELQTKTATTQGTEELTKIKEELDKTKGDLLKYRRRYDLDNDPEVKSKFDEPVALAEKSIADTLNKYNLGESTLKVIQDLGGFAEFSRSGKVFSVKEIDPSDPTKTVSVQKTAGELVRSWLNTMDSTNPADAEYIRAQMARQFAAKDDKKRFVEKETAEAEKYFKEQDEQRRNASVQQEANLKKVREEYTHWAEDQIKKLDWMKLKDVPSNSSPEQRKQIEEHNAFTKQLHTMLRNPPTDSKDKVMETLLGGVEAHHLRRENGVLQEKIKSITAEMEKLKNGTRTTPKTGSLLTSSRKEEIKKPTKLGVNFEQSLDDAIARAERGDTED